MRFPLPVAAALCLASGCATLRFGSPQSEERIAHITQDSSVAQTIVQVRTYAGSPTVSVVAWDEEDTFIGLRSSVTRTGARAGGFRRGDHIFYMAATYGDNLGGYRKAAIMPAELRLMGAGGGRDSYACFYGTRCSPVLTRGLSIPDSVLRANQDSLVITFFPKELDPWTVTLHRDLITAYLRKVDSVTTAMNRYASR